MHLFITVLICIFVILAYVVSVTFVIGIGIIINIHYIFSVFSKIKLLLFCDPQNMLEYILIKELKI